MIALNFLDSGKQEFEFKIYRAIEPLKPSDSMPIDCKGYRLPPDSGSNGKDNWPMWPVSLTERKGFSSVKVSSDDNRYLTANFICFCLHRRAKELGLRVNENRGFSAYSLEVQVEDLPCGTQCVRLEPYYLFQSGSFGLICGFHFCLKDNEPYSIEAQKASFSLDESGKSNRAKLKQLGEFLGRFINKHKSLISNLDINDDGISFGPKFISLQPVQLPTPRFIGGNQQSATSAFSALHKYGPASKVVVLPRFVFCFEEPDREISRRVYKGLRGESPGNFKGLEKTYDLEIGPGNVASEVLSDWDTSSLETLANNVNKLNANDTRLPFVILVLPRQADDDEGLYWRAKATLLKAGVHSQLIRRTTIVNPRTFEYSLPNLSLNIFAKCGGTPWLAETTEATSLVIGVSQSIQRDTNGSIVRVFGYAVVTDTTGHFHGMKFLADSENSTDYGQTLQSKLVQLISDNQEKYDRCVIHASFLMRKKDLTRIQNAAAAVATNDFQVIAIQLSDSSKWLGFDKSDPMFVPDNGTLVSLSNREAVAWLVATDKGLNSGRPNRPVFAKQLYPRAKQNVLTQCLKEASGLSGLSWRNFGKTSLPVSILYARRVSEALLHCPELREILASKDSRWPWFI